MRVERRHGGVVKVRGRDYQSEKLVDHCRQNPRARASDGGAMRVPLEHGHETQLDQKAVGQGRRPTPV